jgi:phosphatidylglycerophosphate synthase
VDTYFYFICPGEKFYKFLRIPKSFPPEGIVLLGFIFSCLAAICFALSPSYPIAGFLAALCVYGNFVSDYMDGRHARTTGQCRNGGELLDHFFDPLSFSVIIIGFGVAVSQPYLALLTVLGIYCNVAIVFQEAMIMGVLTLKVIGPNEARVLYMFAGIVQSLVVYSGVSGHVVPMGMLVVACLLSVSQTVIELFKTVEKVNKYGPEPDNEGWIRHEKSLTGEKKQTKAKEVKKK